MFREGDQSGTHTLCRDRQEGHVYTSLSNQLQIIMLGPASGNMERSRHFLLRYKSKDMVVDCREGVVIWILRHCN